VQNHISIKIDGEVHRIEVDKTVVESLKGNGFKTVVERTRHIAEIMINSGRGDTVNLKHLFSAQIEEHAKAKTRNEEYERYLEVLESLGSRTDPLSIYDFNYRKGLKGENTVLTDCIDHILEQGWERGTLVAPIKGGAPKAIVSISRDGKLILEGKAGLCNPRNFKTHKAKT